MANDQLENTPGRAMLWLDPGRSGRMSDSVVADLLQPWLANSERSAVLLMAFQGSNLKRTVGVLDEFELRIVHAPELTADERADVDGLVASSTETPPTRNSRGSTRSGSPSRCSNS